MRNRTSCWPAPARIGQWWPWGFGPPWADRAAPPKPGGGGCGRPSWPPGPCPGGWPPRLASGPGGAALAPCLAPWFGLVVGMLAAMAVGWGLRFRPSRDARAWRQGAAGERRTARLLDPLE